MDNWYCGVDNEPIVQDWSDQAESLKEPFCNSISSNHTPNHYMVALVQFQDHEPPKLPLRFTPPSCTHLRGHYSSGRDISEVHFCFKQTQKGRSTALVRIVWLCAPFSFSGPKHNFNMNGMYPLDASILSALPPPSMQITLTKATCLKDLICRPNTKVAVLKDHVKPWNTAESSASLLSRNHAASGYKQFRILHTCTFWKEEHFVISRCCVSIISDILRLIRL